MKKVYLSLLFSVVFAAIYAQCPVQIQKTNVTCFSLCNGTAMAFGSGPAPYTYSWAPGGQTTSTITGLCAGTYTVTVTNSIGCTGTATAIITQPPQLTATTTQTNVFCNGGCNGSATVMAGGGTAPYTYTWSTTPSQLTATATGLCAGSYTVTVRDVNNCMRTAAVTITQPPQLTATTTTVNASCSSCCDGSATGGGSGGTPPFVFSWSPGGQTTQTITGLCPGTYTFCIMDANGCTSCAAATVSFSTAIEELSGISAISIHPVPAADHISVSFINEYALEAKILIKNIIGETVYTENSGSVKQVSRTLDISGLPKAIYFLTIETASGTIARKIVKE